MGKGFYQWFPKHDHLEKVLLDLLLMCTLYFIVFPAFCVGSVFAFFLAIIVGALLHACKLLLIKQVGSCYKALLGYNEILAQGDFDVDEWHWHVVLELCAEDIPIIAINAINMYLMDRAGVYAIIGVTWSATAVIRLAYKYTYARLVDKGWPKYELATPVQAIGRVSDVVPAPRSVMA
jgi:hypothetical protein